MKNRNGFTLVELLAVIVLLGIIIVLVTPNVTKNLDDSKKGIESLEIKSLEDAAKLYINSIADGVDEITLGGVTYSEYDFLTYVENHSGINIPLIDLINNEYFNDNCDYTSKKDLCTFNQDCSVDVTITLETQNNYLVINKVNAVANNCHKINK